MTTIDLDQIVQGAVHQALINLGMDKDSPVKPNARRGRKPSTKRGKYARECKGCGADIPQAKWNQKWCDACREERYEEAHDFYQDVVIGGYEKRHANDKLIQDDGTVDEIGAILAEKDSEEGKYARDCERCKKHLPNATWNQRWCASCRKDVEAEREAEPNPYRDAHLTARAIMSNPQMAAEHAMLGWIIEQQHKGKVNVPKTDEGTEALLNAVRGGERGYKALNEVIRKVEDVESQQIIEAVTDLDDEIATAEATLVAAGVDKDLAKVAAIRIVAERHGVA